MSAMHPAQVASELRSYSFFKDFPEETILVLSTMTRPVEFQKDDYLLRQGEENDSLLFIRNGVVAILVDGQKVSEISTVGEVFGEMSLINRRPVMASVKALSPVSAFQLNQSYIQGLTQKDQQKFQQLLYRVYATVLSDRLVRTNDKAKRFEIANEELQKAHESLRKMNKDLESEIARRSKELVQKIHDLTETHLQPAQTVLSKWVLSESKNVSSGEAQKLLRSISEVVDFLKPVGELGLRGVGGEPRRILLCDPNRKQQTVAKLALGGTGVHLSLASTLEELGQNLREKNFDLILCDAELKDLVTKIIEVKPNTPLALLVNLDMNFYLQTLQDFPQQSFFISRDVNNKTFTIKNISTTVTKIMNKDFFGMEKYLSWGAHIVEKPVRDSALRLEMIDSIEEHFKSFGIRSSILDRVHTVAEELLMNAIYDAPVDESGHTIYNHLSRTEKIILSSEQEAKLRYGTDGVLLAVSVSDPFGALSKDIIMKYLSSCYQGQACSLEVGKGGAGRGLHLMIESADLTVFNVKKGLRTEVISLFNLEKTGEVEGHSTFHLFLS
jgi:CRP-like cAMP-binding protein/CheY-like chemotaxis protein